VAAVALEAMPRDAKGVAVFEVTSIEDKQDIDAPAGIDMHWILHPDPQVPSDVAEKLIRDLEWPNGRVQTCIAGESSAIRSLRAYLSQDKGVDRDDLYISGYWKIGLVEDEHQRFKKTNA
jgi:NADPH-dependent ferric siderophore reductase